MLAKRGKGVLSRLAKVVERSVSQIADIKSGRGLGGEKLKQKITNYFEMVYEEFLSFGAKLLTLEKNKQ